MTHLLDTNICSAHMRRPGGLAHRFIQYSGNIAIPTVVLAELYAGAHKHDDATRLLRLISELREGCAILDFDSFCAERFGILHSGLLNRLRRFFRRMIEFQSPANIHPVLNLCNLWMISVAS